MIVVATSLVAQAEQPFGERIVLAAVGPLITVLLGGLVVWAVTSKVQHNREKADRESQNAREDSLKGREEQRAAEIRAQDIARADAEKVREQLARDDSLRQELVASMTEAAGTLYLTGQHYWRLKRAAQNNPGNVTEKAREDFRTILDTTYLQSRKAGEVIENRLHGYFSDTGPRDQWHGTMDLLTVRYFQLIDEDTDRLYRDNEGEGHTGLTVQEMKNPKLLLNKYRQLLKAAVQSILETQLRARS